MSCSTFLKENFIGPFHLNSHFSTKKPSLTFFNTKNRNFLNIFNLETSILKKISLIFLTCLKDFYRRENHKEDHMFCKFFEKIKNHKGPPMFLLKNLNNF